ncbi:hypothetical protein [Noviherbaspirillum galbum]|uniref:Uncharacterized protein n=1 Tax=Noviherbaspirillum galbum TaxID=2709383 RepID=A0A6B3SU37_9BURK|nr:hypothetical protein [Noviherbaspirillum galbum]NEX64194.1 hypothetical protein [Noviherbaspirillum galbum]
MSHLYASTDAAIEQLVDAMCSPDADDRQRHVCRESLRSLVRLAKSEYRLEISKHVDRVAHLPVKVFDREEITLV